MPDEKKPLQPHAIIHGVEKRPLPATVQTEKAPEWAIRMQEGLNANHKVVLNQIQGLEGRLDALENWRKTGKHAPVTDAAIKLYGDGTRTASGEIRRISENDLAQDAKHAETLIWRNKTDARLDAQDKVLAETRSIAQASKDNTVDIKKAVGGFMKQHPEIGQAISALIVAVIVLLTLYVQSKAHP